MSEGEAGRAYDWAFRHILRRIDAERSHRISFGALRAIAAMPGGTRLIRRVCRTPALPVHAMGLEFPTPLGLAAGFDKDGLGVDALGALGFGFVEVGTVTAQPQPGNPRPRILRLVDDQALVNRMGFNNAGATATAARLRRRSSQLGGRLTGPAAASPIVGVNIGKTQAVPDEKAIDDYATSATLLAAFADYLVVNVSSPNTPGLRDLQAVDRLRPLLLAVGQRSDEAAERHVPLLVKISPDLAEEDVIALAELALELGLDGIVATNTTIARAGLTSRPSDIAAVGDGGLSGAPLHARSLKVLELLRARVGSSLALISAGGVMTAADADRRLRVGATLVQAYTGLIYGGPLWPSRVTRGLTAVRARV